MKTSQPSSTMRDISEAGGFHTTRWTQVVRAKERTDAGLDALRDLCAAYYAPVIAFLRRLGNDPDTSREMAHEFFARVLEGGAIGGADSSRGRFRSYLLGAVKHFLSHQRESEGRLRRGAGLELLSLDAESETAALLAIADDEHLTPDAAFDRQWALTVLDRALESLRVESADAAMFEKLQPWLTGAADHGEQAALAESLGMNPNSIKTLLHRMKRRFRTLLKAEVAGTLDDEAAVDDEMTALFAALRGR